MWLSTRVEVHLARSFGLEEPEKESTVLATNVSNIGKFSDKQLFFAVILRSRRKIGAPAPSSKMFPYLVLLLCLSWPHVIRAENAEPRNEVLLDQVAIASQSVAHNVEKSEQKEKDFRDQLITSIIDTTMHYENSNGFVPMVSPSPTDPALHQLDALSISTEASNVTGINLFNERDNSSIVNDDNYEDEEIEPTDEIEKDPAYSTEGKIYLSFPSLDNNRRSFEYQGAENDFEILKVGNNTPVVANYPDFYVDPPSSSEDAKQKTQSSSRRRVKGKGKKMEDYTGNYGIALSESNGDQSFNRYYSHDSTKHMQKANREQGKVAGNYQQEHTISYYGHGQETSRQNAPTSSSFPKTNQKENELPKNNVKNYEEVYDTVPSSSQAKNHRFSKPVVVTETNYNYEPSPRISNDFQTSRFLDSASSEMSNPFTFHNRDGRFRSDEDSRDVSDDTDYIEYTERPRRVQKGRRRPSSTDSSKRLPKEHRGSVDDSNEYESQGKRYHSSRTKSHRQKVRGNSWMDDDRQQDHDDSYEDTRYDGRMSGSETRHTKSQQNSFKSANSWNQISPNLEISHSSGIEIGQLEKPKLIVPVKVNLVPVANFDHATAIGNSQGFDMSNAVLQNIVSATPVNTVSTPTSLISTPESVGLYNDAKFRIPTPVSNIVVGQNNFQNQFQATFQQLNDQNKFSTNLKPQYVSSTVAPIYAVTPSLASNLQTISSGQDIQGAVTPRPTYVNTLNQHVSTNPVQQFIVPQPTLQTVPTLLQTPVQSNSDFNIQVNSHGMHGQNIVNSGNYQLQSMPTLSTVTPTPQTVPVTKINLVSAESQNKKTLIPGNSANFLATASLSVGQQDQRQSYNGNPFYVQQSNPQQVVKPQVQPGIYQQVLKNVNVAPKLKTYIQTTHLVPALLQPMPTITTISASTPQVMPDQENIQGSGFALQQHQNQNQQYARIPSSGMDHTLKNIRMPSLMYQSIDNVGSHSTSNLNTVNTLSPGSGITENAHLPYVGAKNVEILNPNIKPTPLDATIINAFETMHYPTAVLTTPIPMFTTTSFVTARPLLSSSTESVNVQNFLNSWTDVGSRGTQQFAGDQKAYQSQEKAMFNPINFVPNIDIMKNQNALNSKLHASEPLQQNLNLVPLLPGGNFFKPSFSAQSELLVKPKLASDLETYAEQMFKESLKTIYNTQKWNNDRKNIRHNTSDSMDIARLRNELQRLKASLSDSKHNKDHEAHHSETKVQTTELPGKKPDELLAALEQMLKNQPSDSSHGYYGSSRPHRNRRPSDQEKYNFGPSSDFKDTKHIKEFLTPPQPNSHRSKGHFHDKPGKKRPMSGPSRYNNHGPYHGPRPHSRPNLSHKSGGLEGSATNVDPVHVDSSKYDNFKDYRHRSEFKRGPHSSFTNPQPEKNHFSMSNKHQKVTGNKEDGFNHPRMHNFLGLLMKNKQLPTGNTPNYFRNKDQLRQYFEEEKQRLAQQLYDETLKDYLYKMSGGMTYSNLAPTDSDAGRSMRDNVSL